jgi:hypothetical protein
MKIQPAILAVILLPAFVTPLAAMSDSDARRILANEPFMPSAGDTPGTYQQRLVESKARKYEVERLRIANSELTALLAQSRKLELQIQTGMMITEDGKGSPLTQEQKAAMLAELLGLQTKIIQTESEVRDLAEALAKDDLRIESEKLRRELHDAQLQQIEDLRREHEEQRYRKGCR